MKIGSSKFAELRLQNVFFSSQTPSNVCTCIYHQSLFLALDAIHIHAPNIPTYSTDIQPPVYVIQRAIHVSLVSAVITTAVLLLYIPSQMKLRMLMPSGSGGKR